MKRKIFPLLHLLKSGKGILNCNDTKGSGLTCTNAEDLGTNKQLDIALLKKIAESLKAILK